MKRRIAFFSVLFFIVQAAKAQSLEDLNHIQIKWKMGANDHLQKGQFSAAFLITNNGNTAVNLSDWILCFSYPREIKEVISKNAKFENKGGEFVVMNVLKGFGIIDGKKKLEVNYLAKGKTLNITDAPSGLYFVSKTNPGKLFTVKNFASDLSTLSAENEMLAAAQRYQKFANTNDINIGQLHKVIPKPVSYIENKGFFKLNANTKLIADSAFVNEAKLFNQEISSLLGTKLNIAKSQANNAVVIKLAAGLSLEEYRLTVADTGVQVEASTPQGAFYGLQSLKMLMPTNVWAKRSKEIAISKVEINDYPRFAYRSLMLDVARNFQPKAEILKLLDLLALYKINTFHFHLNDDEGWRLEIKSLPELTELGAKRGHTFDDATHLKPAYGSGADTTSLPGSGYYTQEDFIEILKYAKDRHITVIPELETPGHARAAVKAMDYRYRKLMAQKKHQEAIEYLLRDTSDQSVYKSVQGYKDNVMNVALPSTYRFINTVVDELVSLYQKAGARLSTVHMGGDEVPQGVWEKSPAIAQLMTNKKIITYDDLWYYYLGKVNQLLKSKNLHLSGWEEVAMRKVKDGEKLNYIANPDFLGENFQVYVWNNVWGGGSEDLAYRLANAGYKVVLSAVTNYYFDLAYQKDTHEPGLYWGSYVDTDKPFYFSPFDYYKTAREALDGTLLNRDVVKGKERLTEEGKKNIVGIQSQLWSEKIYNAQSMQYMLLPKLIAYAERAWTTEPDWSKEVDSVKSWQLYLDDWSRFANVVGKRELNRLSYYHDGFNFRVPPPGVIIDQGKIKANVQFPELVIRYTADGAEPHAKSEIYRKEISAKGIIKFKAFTTSGAASRTIMVQNPKM
ncbi:MAG: family 20 glycosylhydrolase [Pedobacter sp.]|uniref:beta-N-acetylhexosaminidase n=1 Tax=Pedobacter sp. TaxID=1411316 RepID=UPI0028085AA4|nr:family 20 glycosylhydrolase [Pedobacter sp.]MDQ8005898.1 family 20 glycosylhydrolase [Pedobacter sp.]